MGELLYFLFGRTYTLHDHYGKRINIWKMNGGNVLYGNFIFVMHERSTRWPQHPGPNSFLGNSRNCYFSVVSLPLFASRSLSFARPSKREPASFLFIIKNDNGWERERERKGRGGEEKRGDFIGRGRKAVGKALRLLNWPTVKWSTKRRQRDFNAVAERKLKWKKKKFFIRNGSRRNDNIFAKKRFN